MARPRIVGAMPGRFAFAGGNVHDRCTDVKRRFRKGSRMAGLEIRRKHAVYSDEEIEHALTTLARHSGNAEAAARELPQVRNTLDKWRKVYADRYREIQEQVIPEIRARVAERQAELAEKLADAEELALAETVAALPDLEARDKAGALRNISTSKGITLTHLQAYQAPPPDPTAGSVADVFERLGKLGLLAKPVEAEATEEPVEAEVIPESA